MLTKTRRKNVLNLDTLAVQSLVMPGPAPMRMVTTSQTCPTRCDTEFDCTNADTCRNSECGTCVSPTMIC